jgi:hypothetical protein
MTPDGWFHVLGVDPALGGVGRTKLGKDRFHSDDFCLATLRAKQEGPAELIHMFRGCGLTDNQMSAQIHRQDLAFGGYDLIVMDPGGGGLSVRDKLREPIQDTGAEKFKVTPIITKDDEQLRGAGRESMVLFGRSDSRIKGRKHDGTCPGVELILSGESVLPNKMHELLRGALECDPQGIRFPAPWNGPTFASADLLRDYLNETPMHGRVKIQATIDLALAQLVQVDRKMSPDGTTPYKDKLGLYEFTSMSRKDCAYSLAYAYFALWILRTEFEIRAREAKKQKKKAVVTVDEARI